MGSISSLTGQGASGQSSQSDGLVEAGLGSLGLVNLLLGLEEEEGSDLGLGQKLDGGGGQLTHIPALQNIVLSTL